ncbi:hypothetical protein ACFWAP_11255 [Streptomyces goshikiensis]|uniref:hypothetical protein n=1 Tax=Streptomyces goshikiensis TaxID=1942 RepID=UPI00365FD124
MSGEEVHGRLRAPHHPTPQAIHLPVGQALIPLVKCLAFASIARALILLSRARPPM